MHARKTTIKGSPDQVDRAKEVIESKVIPGVREMPGFKGGYWLFDRETGDAVSFTFFDTKDSLGASSEAANRLRGSASGEMGASITGVDEYEVGADTGATVHRGASHARVLHFDGDPANADAAVTMIEERVIPGVRAFPGFVGGFWLIDREAGKGVGVTLYDSAENLKASRAPADTMRTQSAGQLGGTFGEFKEYEVLARTEAPERVGAGG